MTVISGAKAGFWCPHVEAVSVAATAEAMTEVGSTLEYYITDRAHAWWDPTKAVVVYDGVTPVAPARIDYAGGYVMLPSTPAGAVTCDVYCYDLEALGGAYGVKADLRCDTRDCTVFSNALNSAVAWKEFTSTMESWTMTVQKHFFFAKASVTTALAGTKNDLKWEWIKPGVDGNAEALVYSADGALEIARAANITTVTYEAAVTTAAAIKAHLEADPVLTLLWATTYPTTDDTAGYHTGAQNPSVDISGGSDTSFCIKVDSEVATQTIVLTVGGLNSGALIAAAMQAGIRAKGGAYTLVTVTYEGAPVTDYYLITSGTKGATSAVTITDATTANVADNLKIAVANGGVSTAGTSDDGSGIVAAVSHVHAAGGRSSDELARLGQKVLCCMYLNTTTGSVIKLEGVGIMTGITPSTALEELVESDISFQGTSALRMHTL